MVWGGGVVVKGPNKKHIVTVVLSACVIADEKVGRMACGCHNAAQAFWKSGSSSATGSGLQLPKCMNNTGMEDLY